MHAAVRLFSGILLLCWAVSSRAQLAVNPGQLNFPIMAVGATAGPLFVTLSNTGTTTLTVVSLTAATGVYARAGGSCGMVPFALTSQASCTLGYTFTPNSVDTFYQLLRATPNAGDFVDFGLAGEGALGRLVVDRNLDFFQPIPVGTISQEKIASLMNEGAAPVRVTAIAPFIVPPVVSFVRTGGNCPEPPFTINPFLGCQIRYVFAPVVVGEVQLDMQFHNNAGSAETMTLRGVGTPGELVFANGFEGN